jgi:hypothetical protein
MQGIYTYIPKTNHVPKECNEATISVAYYYYYYYYYYCLLSQAFSSRYLS